jgi:antitoxin FitA
MGQFSVRNIENEVVSGLKIKARLAGVSFETLVRDILRAAAPLSGKEKAALIEEFQSRHGPVLAATPPEDIISQQRAER